MTTLSISRSHVHKWMSGGPDEVTLIGAASYVGIRGQGGDDLLHDLASSPSGSGSNVLCGGSGNDVLSVENPSTVFHPDTLVGGAGDDLFQVALGSKAVIADYGRGSDTLLLYGATVINLDQSSSAMVVAHGTVRTYPTFHTFGRSLDLRDLGSYSGSVDDGGNANHHGARQWIYGGGYDDAISVSSSVRAIIQGGPSYDAITLGRHHAYSATLLLETGDTYVNDATSSDVFEYTNFFDTVTNVVAGDKLDLSAVSTTLTLAEASDLAGVQGAVCYVRGSYDAAQHTFALDANGKSSAVTFDDGAHFETVILVGYVPHHASIAGGIVTL